MRSFSGHRASRTKRLVSQPICIVTVLISMANNQHVDADCHLAEQIAAMYGIDVASIETPDAEHVMFLTPAKIFQRCPVIARRAIEPRLLVSFHPRRQSEHPCSLPDMYSKRWAGWVDTAVCTASTQRMPAQLGAIERARLTILSWVCMRVDSQDPRLRVSTSSIEAGISYRWTNWMPTRWMDAVTAVDLQQALIAVLTGALLLHHVPGVNLRTAGLPDRMMLVSLFDRYDADHDGYLNVTEYTLLLHDIGVNVRMTSDRWAAERKQLNAPDAGLDMGHLEILYSNPKYRRGKFEMDYSLVRELPLWPGRGGWVSDHYRLGNILGASEQGRVHAAVSTTAPDSDVAVKILNKQALGFHAQNARKRRQSLGQCFREIHMLAAAGHHPNITQILGAYQAVEEIALVMPLATGGQVYDVLTQRGKYSEADVREVIRSVGSALSHCHSHGIIHGDVKPANVLYADHFHELIKLVDIGCVGSLSTRTRRKQTSSTSSRIKLHSRKRSNRHDPLRGGGHNIKPSPTLTGTMMYMAPELFVDLEADYSRAHKDCNCAERDAVAASILAQSAAAFASGFVTILLLLASASHLGLLDALDISSSLAATDVGGLWEPPSPEQCFGVGVVVSLFGVAVYCHPQRAARACHCKCWRCCCTKVEHLASDPQSSGDEYDDLNATPTRPQTAKEEDGDDCAEGRHQEAEEVAPGCDCDEGVDIWALGVMTYELLFGAVPFDADSEAELKSLIAIGAHFARSKKTPR